MALKDANENPWYILMTLHGEQEGEEIDWALHEKNRKLWNAWSCQGLPLEKRTELATSARIDVAETEWTDEIAQEVQRLFEVAFLARNPELAAAPRIPDASEGIHISCLNFTQPVALRYAVFCQDVLCRNSKFKKVAEFSYASFMKTAHFSNRTHFDGGARFTGASFAKDAYFFDAIFKMRAEFEKARFFDDSNFIHSKFEGTAIFAEATFTHHARFSLVNFEHAAVFRGVSFEKDADFSGTCFEKRADFRNVKCAGLADFRGRSSISQADEYRCVVHPKLDSFGDNTLFSGAHFQNCVVFYRRRFGPYTGRAKEVTFANAIFDGPVSFEGAAFPHLLPDLTNTTLPQSTKVSAESTHWPDPPGPLKWFCKRRLPEGWKKPEQVKASAAALRHAMTRQTLPEEAHFFFRYEMNAAALIGGIGQRLPYGLFCLFSDFGYSIARPVNWLAGVYGLGLGALFGWFAESYNLLHALGLAAVTSFANMLPIFGFQRVYLADVYKALPPALQLISGAQTVLAFVFLFFLGLGLRTRFRLK